MSGPGPWVKHSARPPRLHRRQWTALAVVAVVTVVVAGVVVWTARRPSSGVVTTTGPAPAPGWRPPPVRHVFVIMLENENFGATFGDPSADPYLARTLARQGALLSGYYAIGHNSADNYIGFVSGQAPSPQTQQDCGRYSSWRGSRTPGGSGQVAGSGCVYPSAVQTLGNQLSDHGWTWKAYMQDMGNDRAREAPVCGHPRLDHTDETQAAVSGDGYATRHDPFVYFRSITGRRGYCDTHVVPLGNPNGSLPSETPKGVTGLASDLRSVTTTPNFSFISPNLCSDGHDSPCVNQGRSGSPVSNLDAFLRTWVPRITESPAFRADGLLEITFDESSGPGSDSRACCNESPGPNVTKPGITGPGGGKVGAVLLSPFIKPGTRTARPYNHYSSLASIEELFGLPRLGEARSVSTTFGPDVFTLDSPANHRSPTDWRTR